MHFFSRGFISALIFTGVLALAGCGTGGESPTPTPPVVDPDNQEITILDDADSGLTLPSGSGETTQGILKFKCTQPWNITVPSNASGWISVNPRTGPAGEEVTVVVTVQPNDTYDERNATLVINAGSLSRTFKVVQKQKAALLLSTDKVEMTSAGGAFDVVVRSSINYTCNVPSQFSSWIKQQNSRALTEQTLSFTVEANEGNEAREGYVDFTGEGLSERVRVYQTHGDILVLSAPEQHIGAEGGTLTVELRSNCQFSMSAPSAPWLKVDASRAVSTHTIYFVVEPYDALDGERTATVTFTSADGSAKETLTVIQHDKSALIIGDSEITLPPTGGAFKVAYATNREVSCKIDTPLGSWLHKSESRAMRDVEEWFTADVNPHPYERTGELTFRAEDTEAKVTVRQEGYSIDVTGGPRAQIMDARSHNYDFTVKANVPLTVVTEGNLEARGKDGNVYHFHLNANVTAGECPQSYIKFYWGDLNLVSAQVILSQPAPTMALQRESVIVRAEGETIAIPLSSNSEPPCILMTGDEKALTINQTEGTVTVGPNSSAEQRKWTIRARFDKAKSDEFVEFTVIQQGAKTAFDKELTALAPGNLAKSLGSGASSIASLKISGQVNATDIYMLNYLAANGKLRSVDMRDVKIIADGSTYKDGFDTYTIAEDNTLGRRQFHDSKLEHIVLPSGLKKIGRQAFETSSIQEIDIPQGVTEIGDCAFHGCNYLTRASVPGTVRNLDDEAFHQCLNLASVELGEGIGRIGKRAFAYMFASPNGARTALRHIKIPQSVTEIDTFAFQGSGLVSIELPANLKKLGAKVFYMNYDLQSATLHGVPAEGELPQQTFYYCDRLTQLHLPEGLTRLGSSSLAQIRPEELVLPSTLKVIGESAMHSVWARKVVLPEGLTTVERAGMAQMPFLEVLELPANLVNIGQGAFNSTYYSLREIRCHAAVPPTMPADAFGEKLERDIPLYVPAGSKAAYQAAAVWKDFTNIIEY